MEYRLSLHPVKSPSVTKAQNIRHEFLGVWLEFGNGILMERLKRERISFHNAARNLDGLELCD